MTGPQLLTLAIIIAFVLAFIITMVVLNIHAKKMFSTNSRLVDNQNALLEQNKQQEKDKTELKKRINELEEELKNQTGGEVAQLREQTREYRENIELTSDMSDDDLLAWIDKKMDEMRLYTDTNLTLKSLANALGLTQRRLGSLFKSHPNYTSLGDYLNEKRVLLACRLLRENRSHWNGGRIWQSPHFPNGNETPFWHHAIAIPTGDGNRPSRNTTNFRLIPAAAPRHK